MKRTVISFFIISSVLFAMTAFYTLSSPPPKNTRCQPLGLLVRAKTIEQFFTATRDNLSGISYMLSTYGRRNMRTLDVKVLDVEMGTVISDRHFHGNDVRDNTIYKQHFSPQANSKGRLYKIVFRSDDISPKNALTVIGMPVRGESSPAMYGGIATGLTLYCEIAYDVISFRSGLWVVLCSSVVLCGLLAVDLFLRRKEGKNAGDGSVASRREGNIELLRLVLMFLILLHHHAYSGAWAGSVWQPGLMLAYTVFTYWHVVAFVAISGWFGINFSWRKALRFWGMVFFYSALPLALDRVLYGKTLDVVALLGPNKRLWFVGPYLALMLLSPVLNAAIIHLKDNGALLKAWSFFALVIFCCWGPHNFGTFMDLKGSGPATLMTLAFVYFSARALKVSGIYRKLDRGHLLLLFFLCLAGISCWGIADNVAVGCFNPVKWFSRYVMYDNLLLIAAGICVVVYFSQYVKVADRWSPLVLFLGKSAFSLYLLQSVYTFNSIRLDSQKYFSNQLGLSPMISVLAVSLIVFLGFLAIDIARRLLLSMVVAVARMIYRAVKIQPSKERAQ